jgi:HEPN domain-containing protein
MSDNPSSQSATNWKEWLERANEDLLMAKSAVRRKTPLTYGATFHSQQCVEKIIKAILISRNINFPRTHDLAALGQLSKQSGVILPLSDDSLDLLSGYGVESRYPGTQLTVEEAKVALGFAITMIKFSRKVFPR